MVGRKAAACGSKPMSFGKNFRPAVDWLVSHDFASRTSENKMVLLSSCLESRATLSRPKLIELPDDNAAAANTMFGYRKKMLILGWVPSESGARASIEKKVFRKQQAVKSYYELLLTRC